MSRRVDLVLDLHRASLHQNVIVIFDKHNQIAVVSSEEFSHKFWERQLIFSRNSRLTHDFHGFTPEWEHGIREDTYTVTSDRGVW